MQKTRRKWIALVLIIIFCISFISLNGIWAAEEKKEPEIVTASRLGDLNRVKELLADPATDVNKVLPRRKSALMCAAQGVRCKNEPELGESYLEIVKLLVAAGANITYVDGSKDNALLVAVRHKRSAIINFLIGSGDQVNINFVNTCGESPALLALKNRDSETCKLIFKLPSHKYIVPAKKDTNGKTPFSYAEEWNNKDIPIKIVQENMLINEIGDNSGLPRDLSSIVAEYLLDPAASQ